MPALRLQPSVCQPIRDTLGILCGYNTFTLLYWRHSSNVRLSIPILIFRFRTSLSAHQQNQRIPQNITPYERLWYINIFSTTQKTLDQSQSHLLTLPLELREMIYKYVLGDTVLHIVHKERKLGHLRCKAVTAKECPLPYRDSGSIRESCWGNVDSGNVMTGQVTTDGGIIPFLQTCRQM